MFLLLGARVDVNLNLLEYLSIFPGVSVSFSFVDLPLNVFHVKKIRDKICDVYLANFLEKLQKRQSYSI